MTDLLMSLDGKRLTSCRLTIVEAGLGWFDWKCDEEMTPRARGAELVLADLRVKCAPWRFLPFQGSSSGRMIFGAGGWRQTLPPNYYRHDAGVRLSTVLGDAARVTGETLQVARDFAIGPRFAREEGPAQRLLNCYCPGWYVGLDGVTHTAPRAPSRVATEFDLVSPPDGVRGRVVVAAEALAQWVPGASFKNATTPELVAAHVVHIAEGSSLRTEVLWR